MLNPLFAAVGVLLGTVALPNALAAGTETGIGFGPAFYSGAPAESLTPQFGLDVSYHSANLLNRYIHWTHRFDLGFLISGTNLAGQGATYNGIAGTYVTSLRVNFSKQTVIPYVEFGPALGIFALLTSGGPADSSANQAALKYGYAIGTGFDLKKGGAGTGGWGVSVSYFNFLTSPAVYEFPSGAVNAKGVRLDFRYLFANEKGK